MSQVGHPLLRLHLNGLLSKYDPQHRCLRNPNSRPSGKTPAGAPPEAPQALICCWLFSDSIQTRISAVKIDYFLKNARVSSSSPAAIQGYLAHKKPPPPLGPPQGPRQRPSVGSYGVAFSDERVTPVHHAMSRVEITIATFRA